MGTGSTGSTCGQTTLTPGTAAYSVTLSYTHQLNLYYGNPYHRLLRWLLPLTRLPIMDCSNIPCTAPPANPTSSSATTICQGQSATINASGSGSVTYNVWTASTGGTNLGSTPLSVSPSSTTTYYVEALNRSHCLPECSSELRLPLP
jgi:hypothetical protein